MANFSDFWEDKIINHMLRAVAYTPPANVYLAMFTANTNLEINAPTAEVSGNAYARQEVWLDAASAGATANNADVTFPEATGNWGTLTSIGVVDSEAGTVFGTNVNVLMWGDLASSKTVGTGDTFKIKTGDLDITVA